MRKLLSNRFKLSTEQFRQKFVTHKKDVFASWRDVAFELQNYLEEWIKGLDIQTYEEVKELLITDQLKQIQPPEVRDLLTDGLPKIKSIE